MGLYINGVAVTIDIEGIGDRAVVERVGPEGPSADVTFKCPYNQRFTVVKGLLGSTTNSAGTIVRTPPLAYPPSPNLFCTAIGDITGIKPQTDSFGWVYFDWSRIPAHFSVPSWDAIPGLPNPDPSGLPYTTTRIRAQAEVFVPPNGSYFYIAGAENTKPVYESSVGIIRSRCEIAMTRHNMPFIPIDKIMEFDGCVNDAAITFGDHEFPRGCLLYTGADTDAKADPSTGDRTWDVTHLFLGNYSIEWNEFLDPHGAWVLVNSASDGSGDYPFEYISFSALFGDSY